jgi:hypothetical protein
VNEDERKALIDWHYNGKPESYNAGGYPDCPICEVEGHYASECPIFAKGEYVLEELQEGQNAREPLLEEPLQEEETAQQESVDRKLCERVEELEARLLQMSTPKSPDLHLPDSAPATYMCAKLWEASGLIKGSQLPSDAAREAESAYPLVYCLMDLNYEALGREYT